MRSSLVFLLLCLSGSIVEAQVSQEQLVSEGAARLAVAARAEGDALRGAIVFHQPWLACSKCHVNGHAGGQAASLGPDLARVGKEVTAEQLIESVLNPSKIIRKGFEPVTVETKDGRSVTGLLVEESQTKVVLRNPSDGKLLTFLVGDIEQRSVGKMSIMPAGQVSQLASRQQFLDLARYLSEIASGGPARAAELQPSASLLVLQVPEYEKQIDHAAMIADWSQAAPAKKAFQRGEAIYLRLCINCHGTKEQLGSLPTSLKFAEGKFKNGAEPFRMYQTLTHGFGLMAPQTWMVPQQKYDVIHYIRETYLKPHNPTQLVGVDATYLANLPKGTTRGPVPSKFDAWSLMNYGPFLTATYEVPMPGSKPGAKTDSATPQALTNFAYKGIAVRLDSGPGGVSRGSHWVVFEHDTLRLSAAWSGSGKEGEPNCVDWNGINFNGAHQVHPKVVGRVHVANPSGPGWANPATGDFVEARVLGRDRRSYGPLPREWGQFKGLYQHGDRIVLSYRVGTTDILEAPGLRAGASTGSSPVVMRTFEVGARSRELKLLVATHPSSDATVETIGVDGETKVTASMALLSSNGTAAASEPLTIAAAVTPAIKGVDWNLADGGALTLSLPAGNEPLRFTVSMRTLKAAGTVEPDDLADLIQSPTELAPMMRGGPRRWPEVLSSTVSRGADSGPFAVDVLNLPTSNPWFAQTRLTGIDFFEDGDRAAICAWDGDVWLVSGLSKIDGPKAEGLKWQRIASGLFQPLGLKIVNGAIYVTCRDQLTRLHDLNGDGETDFYECFNSDHQVTEHFHEFAMGLQVDESGNFYYAKSGRHALTAIVPQHGTLLRVARDGSRTETLATGFRAATGVCLNPDGSFVVTDQEGFWNPKNRINWVTPPKPGEKPKFYGNMFGYHDVTDSSDSAMEPPLCWITNAFDRSPAELLWVTSDRWGPLKGRLLNLSYGEGKVFVVPHEQLGPQMQGGMIELPLPKFPTGIMRGRFHPTDGQLYVCGMFAWAGNVTQPGGLYRIRATGQPMHLPVELHARKKSLSLTFTSPLDRAAVADVGNYSIKVWNLKRTANYGSKHFDERELAVSRATLSDDGRTLTLEIADLAPTWGMSISFALTGADKTPVRGVIHNTIHSLGQ